MLLHIEYTFLIICKYAIMFKKDCLLSVDVWHFRIKLCGGEIGKSSGAQESYWKMFCQQVHANMIMNHAVH